MPLSSHCLTRLQCNQLVSRCPQLGQLPSKNAVTEDRSAIHIPIRYVRALDRRFVPSESVPRGGPGPSSLTNRSGSDTRRQACSETGTAGLAAIASCGCHVSRGWRSNRYPAAPGLLRFFSPVTNIRRWRRFGFGDLPWIFGLLRQGRHSFDSPSLDIAHNGLPFRSRG